MYKATRNVAYRGQRYTKGESYDLSKDEIAAIGKHFEGVKAPKKAAPKAEEAPAPEAPVEPEATEEAPAEAEAEPEAEAPKETKKAKRK